MSRERRAGSRQTQNVIPSGVRNLYGPLALRSLVAALLGMTLLLLLVGCSKTTPDTKSAGPILTALRTTAIPNIDGKADEAVWKAAPALKINTKKGPTVTMKSAYTDSDIFFTASWPDATKTDIQRIWTFTGGAWQGGSPDDSFAVMWNIDGSLKGFSASGCEPLCHKEGDDSSAWRMEILGPPASAALWPGRNQKGDMWDLSLAISNVKGIVSDYSFVIDPLYADSPALIKPRIFRQNDKFTDSAPWRRNVIPGGAIDSAPVYMYKPGLSLETTPYPTEEQMIPIPEGHVFSEGERLPFMIFADGDENWSGSKADLKGKGLWENGVWTVEISRKLNTGTADDIEFLPRSGQTYEFALAIFDATIIGHTTSSPAKLEFSK